MGQLVSDVTEVLNYKQNQKEAKNQRQEILAQMAADEAEKTNLLKKVLATQRAKYGASGVSPDGVTAGAVLRRLKTETAAPYESKRKTNTRKLKEIKVSKPNLLKKWLDRLDELKI